MTPDASFPLDPHHLNGSSSNGSAPQAAPPAPDAFDATPLAMLQEAPNLTRRPVLRALIVAPGGKALAARRIERFLIESGHAVRFERAEAFDEEETAARAFAVFNESPQDAPDLLLLDCGTDSGALALLCSRVRQALPPALPAATQIAVVPHGIVGRDTGLWDAMRAAGADLMMDGDAPPALLEAWLEGGAQSARLRRDLAGARDQLARHQQIDEVTGLLNRRFFFQAAYREVSRARRYGHMLACLMLEVDHLAHINESYGYGCGDGILKTIAGLLRAWTRDSDIVARFAGTKMVLLLPETPIDGAVALREKLQRVVEETPFTWEGEPLPVTLSIGEAERVATPPEPRPVEAEIEPVENEAGVSIREELADVLADADAALYVAKRGARTPAAFVEYTASPDAKPDEA